MHANENQYQKLRELHELQKAHNGYLYLFLAGIGVCIGALLTMLVSPITTFAIGILTATIALACGYYIKQRIDDLTKTNRS